MILKITQLLRFFMHLQMTKRYERKKKKTIQYAIVIFFAALFQN